MWINLNRKGLAQRREGSLENLSHCFRFEPSAFSFNIHASTHFPFDKNMHILYEKLVKQGVLITLQWKGHE